MKTWKLKTTNEFSAERLLLWGFAYFTLGLLHLQLAGLAMKMMAPAGSLPGQNSGRDWRHSRKHLVVVYGPPLTGAFYYIVCCELIAHALIYLYRQLCVCVLNLPLIEIDFENCFLAWKYARKGKLRGGFWLECMFYFVDVWMCLLMCICMCL